MSAQLPPLLLVIMDALRERGWTQDADSHFVDPEGNTYRDVSAAVMAQTMREIAEA